MKRKEIIHFEQLSHTNSSKLIGGFSAVFDNDDQRDSAQKTNNCNGGNLKAGCGSKNVKKKSKPNHVPNSNCKGNCVPGCGGKK